MRARFSKRPWPFSTCVRSGGKGALGEQALKFLVQGWLVVFNDQEVISRLVGHQKASGVALGVQGIGGDHDIVQGQRAEQLG